VGILPFPTNHAASGAGCAILEPTPASAQDSVLALSVIKTGLRNSMVAECCNFATGWMGAEAAAKAKALKAFKATVPFRVRECVAECCNLQQAGGTKATARP
jgi:hypothetical protein